jgi:uncharacterized protein (TIRG00374 family)
MAGDADAPVPSPPMTAITRPAAEPAASAVGTSTTAAGVAANGSGEEVTAEQLSIGRRLRQPRTIISIVLPIGLLLLFVRALPGFQLERLPELLLGANPLLLLVAFLVYYLGFPLRGYRWAILIRATGFGLKTRDSTEIIFLSWMVNCLVPAKLGDIYRAYLLKINSPVSLSRTFGTVFIERILDLFTIVVLGLMAGFVSFRSGLPPEVQALFLIGIVFVILLGLGLLTLRNLGRPVLVRFHAPVKALEIYDRFEEGVFSSIKRRYMPVLLAVTLAIWATEALRLFFVVEALGFDEVHIGISGAVFVALAASLLTAVPLTPAGIGFVEAGIVGIMTLVYNVPPTEAIAIALVDRVISVLSVIVLGALAYVASPLRRGSGITPMPMPAEASAS